MDRLENMLTFSSVAEAGSFAEAADRLNIAKSVVSKRIKDLEVHLNTQLLERTTRRLSLTEAGKIYLNYTNRFLNELTEVEENLRYQNEAPVGKISLCVPSSFGNKFLGPIVSSFLEKYPDVSIHLAMHDRAVDFVKEGFDVAIVMREPLGENLFVTEIAQSRRILVASPAYLQKKGRPETPEDLNAHQCLKLTGEGAWSFKKSGKIYQQHVSGPFEADSEALLSGAARRGVGIASLPSFMMGEFVMRGALEILLEEFEPAPIIIQAVYQKKHYVSPKIIKFVDYLSDHFKET